MSIDILDDELIHQLATFYETHRRLFLYKPFDLHIMLYTLLHKYFGYNGGIIHDSIAELNVEESTMTFSEFLATLQEKQKFEYSLGHSAITTTKEIYQNEKFGIVHDIFYDGKSNIFFDEKSIGSASVFYKGVPIVLEVSHNRIPRSLVTFIEFLDGEGDDMPERLMRCFKLVELELKTLEQNEGGLQ